MDLSSGRRSLFLLFASLAVIPNGGLAGANYDIFFNINHFGAVGDGRTDSTQAVLSAWKAACSVRGRPRVVIPAGTFLVGPVVLAGPCRDQMTVEVKGTVLAPTDLNVFKKDAWISFQYIDGLLVTGHGVFDGQGASTWPHKSQRAPASLKLSFVTNGKIRGITSKDSKHFHLVIFASKTIRIHNLRFSAPGNSPNTDGIHIGDSTDVKVARSEIATGDDCISIGPGSVNVSVARVFCGPGHGISVGSLGRYAAEKDVYGLKVRNCTFSGTTNGVRIKTWQDSKSSPTVSNLYFSDLVMNSVLNPIIIDQEYCPSDNCDHSSASPSTVKISNVGFRDIRGTSASQVAIKLLCSRGVPCKDVQLQDINLHHVNAHIVNGIPDLSALAAHMVGEMAGAVASALCSNVHGQSIGHVIPPHCI